MAGLAEAGSTSGPDPVDVFDLPLSRPATTATASATKAMAAIVPPTMSTRLRFVGRSKDGAGDSGVGKMARRVASEGGGGGGATIGGTMSSGTAPSFHAYAATPVHENDELASRMVTAIEGGDVDAVAALYADDAVIWHNFDRIEQSRDLNLVVLAWMTHNVDGLRYEEIQRHHFDGGFVQQHVLRGTTKTGAELEVPSCLIVHVDGGHITRIDEYLDTAQLQALSQ
ncbi:MAG: hypothetical protein QOI95_642 [Acidimicrobiaceae bacterium]